MASKLGVAITAHGHGAGRCRVSAARTVVPNEAMARRKPHPVWVHLFQDAECRREYTAIGHVSSKRTTKRCIFYAPYSGQSDFRPVLRRYFYMNISVTEWRDESNNLVRIKLDQTVLSDFFEQKILFG